MKIVSLNIEGDKHLQRVIPFIMSEQAELYCLQEVFVEDVTTLLSVLPGYTCSFARNLGRAHNNELSAEGIAVLSRLPHTIFKTEYYHHPIGAIPQRYDSSSLEARWQSEGRSLITAFVRHNNRDLVISNTHFTWTPDGKKNSYQQRDFEALKEYLDECPRIIIVGDFNVARHQNDIYDQLLGIGLVDHVPASLSGSIDLEFHRYRNNPELAKLLSTFMVDYVFSKKYSDLSIRVSSRFGISDHCALIVQLD